MSGQSKNAGGKIQQVLDSSPIGTSQTATTSSWVDITNSSQTITPKSVNSKIRASILCTGSSAGTTADLGIRLVRDGTPVHTRTNVLRGTTTATQYGAVSAGHLDSPNTTNPVTYKWQFNNRYASGTAGILDTDRTIRLEEVEA